MTQRRTVIIRAPAKINLGLEILGKRADGYHEIRTVMAMIDLVDTLMIRPGDQESGVLIDGVPGVAATDNLVGRAIRSFADASGIRSGYEVMVSKAIPSPGGLGGASSDAASTLLALSALHGHPLTSGELLGIASSLGADVPFFLGGPFALASGTGTTLEPLPPVPGWVVLVVPGLEIPAKTPTLYRALEPDDFSGGARVERAAASISKGKTPESTVLGNAFERPLYGIAPQLAHLRDRMLAAGAPFVALSGAGPAHYTLYESESEGRELASRLEVALPANTLVTVIRFLSIRPPVEVLET